MVYIWLAKIYNEVLYYTLCDAIMNGLGPALLWYICR